MGSGHSSQHVPSGMDKGESTIQRGFEERTKVTLDANESGSLLLFCYSVAQQRSLGLCDTGSTSDSIQTSSKSPRGFAMHCHL